MRDPVFEEGEIVVCLNPINYDFTKNKQYVVIEYDPPEHAEGIGFT